MNSSSVLVFCIFYIFNFTDLAKSKLFVVLFYFQLKAKGCIKLSWREYIIYTYTHTYTLYI